MAHGVFLFASNSMHHALCSMPFTPRTTDYEQRTIIMLAKVLSSSVFGVDAYVVEVEVDITMGLPAFATVGLPDGAVRESKDRVKSAIKNTGYRFPPHRITVNLAPADIKKEGDGFDLPMAVGILAATGLVNQDKLQRYLIIGELSHWSSMLQTSVG